MITGKLKYLLILLFLLAGFSLLPAQENYNLNKITLSGNQKISRSRLKNQMSMKQNTFLRNSLFWKKKYLYNESELNIDLQNLTALYQKEGYLHVEIVPKLIVDDENETVLLKLNIRENKPVLISDLIYTIEVADSIKQILRSGLPKPRAEIDLGIANGLRDKSLEISNSFLEKDLKVGERFRDEDLKNSQKKLLTWLQNESYPFSEVDYKLKLNEDQSEVKVEFIIIPGQKMSYGTIKIIGNDKVRESIIRDRITFESGDYFNPKDLQKTQSTVQHLEMFQYTTLHLEESEDKSNLVNVLINVKEAPRLSTQLSVGFGMEERFRTELNITKLGFLGGIRKAVFIARYSYLEPYNISLNLKQPSAFYKRGSLSFNPYILKKNEKGYTQESSGLYWIYKLMYAKCSSFHFDYNYEWNNLIAKSDFIEDELLADGKINYQLSISSFGYSFNNSEPIISPTNGWRFAATAVFSGLCFYSDYHYYQLLSEICRYTLLSDNLVLATRVECDVMEPTRSNETTPLAERFYGGGQSSMRGWLRSELGPKNAEGVPSGGNSLLEASFELRYPIYKIVSGVLFLDCGNIWKQAYQHNLNDLRYALGGGLRIKTPLGAFRLDAAYPIFEQNLPVRFYFSIGEAF
ncbi:MAG: BamA/TamA family outer membrane protein [Candidatus Cloacimonadales bacterium]|nr:BamA/TamA family outer membrane protein [Candidatus Cloacimonadales bacterium]